jgi:hypothetical protein
MTKKIGSVCPFELWFKQTVNEHSVVFGGEPSCLAVFSWSPDRLHGALAFYNEFSDRNLVAMSRALVGRAINLQKPSVFSCSGAETALGPSHGLVAIHRQMLDVLCELPVAAGEVPL